LRGAFSLDNTGHEDEAAAWNAFVLMIGYVIAALGPLSAGLLRDKMGDFATALSLLFSVALIMLELTRFLQPRRDRLTSAR
jgi:CP family cyanate transporter-like MFS transporter